MPLNEVKRAKNSIIIKTTFHQTASKQLKIFFDTIRPISSVHRNANHI